MKTSMKTSMKTTMKTTMKFFAALAIMLGFTMSSMAQSSQTGNVTANATVQTKLEVTQTQALEFGIVDKGQNKIVSTAGIASSNSAGFGSVSTSGVKEGIGQIVRSGIVTYKLTNLPSTLSQVDGAGTLPIANYTTAYSIGSSLAQWDGAGAASGTETAGTLIADGTENIYVHIGATVSPVVGTPIGTYIGTITLSAEYN